MAQFCSILHHKTRLPITLLWAVAILALVWFFLMFTYLNDLFQEEATMKEPTPSKSKLRRNIATLYNNHLKERVLDSIFQVSPPHFKLKHKTQFYNKSKRLSSNHQSRHFGYHVVASGLSFRRTQPASTVKFEYVIATANHERLVQTSQLRGVTQNKFYRPAHQNQFRTLMNISQITPTKMLHREVATVFPWDNDRKNILTKLIAKQHKLPNKKKKSNVTSIKRKKNIKETNKRWRETNKLNHIQHDGLLTNPDVKTERGYVKASQRYIAVSPNNWNNAMLSQFGNNKIHNKTNKMYFETRLNKKQLNNSSKKLVLNKNKISANEQNVQMSFPMTIQYEKIALAKTKANTFVKNLRHGPIYHDIDQYGRLSSQRNMTTDERLDLKKPMERHSFNVTASEAIPLHRVIPDYRPTSCPSLHTEEHLPTASFIICFHNEALSSLLRTVISVLNSVNDSLLREIILVDDGSTFDYLSTKLESFLASWKKVYLVRTGKRQGLVRARLQGQVQSLGQFHRVLYWHDNIAQTCYPFVLKGVSHSSGDVLVFLDSHCECGAQWIEPILVAIKHDHRKIVCPAIDIIQDNTFRVVEAPRNLHGSFEWNLSFTWKQLPLREGYRNASAADAIDTPTMIGGLFAVSRQFFYNIGGYDPGMEIWGGENLELSFRVWQCGGSLQILPCSRVGHVFRGVIPYSFPGGAYVTLFRNAARVAEVWLDDYKRYFYATQTYAREMSIVHSLEERKKLRKDLKCQNFTWYLKHVIPELQVPPLYSVYYGQVKNKLSGVCLTGLSEVVLHVTECVTQDPSQMFSLTTGGQLKSGNLCVTRRGTVGLQLMKCNQQSARWKHHQNKRIMMVSDRRGAELCLSVVKDNKDPLKLGKCRTRDPAQTWSFTLFFNTRILRDGL